MGHTINLDFWRCRNRDAGTVILKKFDQELFQEADMRKVQGSEEGTQKPETKPKRNPAGKQKGKTAEDDAAAAVQIHLDGLKRQLEVMIQDNSKDVSFAGETGSKYPEFAPLALKFLSLNNSEQATSWIIKIGQQKENASAALKIIKMQKDDNVAAWAVREIVEKVPECALEGLKTLEGRKSQRAIEAVFQIAFSVKGLESEAMDCLNAISCDEAGIDRSASSISQIATWQRPPDERLAVKALKILEERPGNPASKGISDIAVTYPNLLDQCLGVLAKRDDPYARFQIGYLLKNCNSDDISRIEKSVRFSAMFAKSAQPAALEVASDVVVSCVTEVFCNPDNLRSLVSKENGAARLRDVLAQAAAFQLPKPAAVLEQRITAAENYIKDFKP